MHPLRRLAPRAGQGAVPYLPGGLSVDVRGQPVNARAGLLIPGAQRAAAEPVVPPGRRAAAGVDGIQRGQEPGQVSSKSGQVGELAQARGLAFDPPVDRPRPGEPRRGLPQRHRLGNRQRQLASQHRQPPVLLGDLGCVVGAAGKADRELPAQPERDVVPPAEPDRDYRQPSPLRELIGHQPGRDLRGNLVPVHHRDHAPGGPAGASRFSARADAPAPSAMPSAARLAR